MDFGLEGKRALVTGLTAGIGLAIARGLAREGAYVWVNGGTEQRVAAAAQSVREAAGALARVDGVAADLSTAAGVEALLKKVADVDVLVNNLGIFEAKPFEQPCRVRR